MKHFTREELTRSDTARKKGLDNTPSAEHRANIEMSVAQLLDPLREAWAVKCAHEQWGTPALNVTSGYRGFRLNIENPLQREQVDGVDAKQIER